MIDIKATVPLSFALALSAAAPNVVAARVGELSELLRPGSLRTFVEPNERMIGEWPSVGRDDNGMKLQMAQGSCWYGYWRRC
jgi:hypothetical protein